jgi:hypothetical protein
MSASEDGEVDLLLGGGRLSDDQRDRIFRDVLAAVSVAEPAARRTSWRWLWAGAAVASTLAGVTLFLVRPTTSSFRAKGADPIQPALVSVECEGGSLDACPRGSRLVFRALVRDGLLAAFAEPRTGGERIWYFEPEHPVSLAADVLEGGYLRQTVVVGPEHAGGLHRLHVFRLASTATRSALLGRNHPVLAEATFDLVVR